MQAKANPDYSYRCNAEFCYRCGVKWKECLCTDWVPELLDQRAQQVVDREAPWPLEPVIRQQRVVAMAHELQENHECTTVASSVKLADRAAAMSARCAARDIASTFCLANAAIC